MSITGENNKNLTTIKKDIMDLKGSVSGLQSNITSLEQNLLNVVTSVSTLANIVSNIPDIGNFTYRTFNTSPGDGAIFANFTGTNKYGIGLNATNVGYDSSDKRLYFEYVIPETKRAGFDLSKFSVRPMITRSYKVNPDLNAGFTTNWLEDSHIETRLVSVDSTKFRIDMYFARSTYPDIKISHVFEHMAEYADAWMEIDLMLIDYN